MLQPLISLWRHNSRVSFFEAMASLEVAESDNSGLSFGSPMGIRRHFYHADEALSYLRFWMGDPGALSELRWLLHKTGSAFSGARGGPEKWLHALASHIQSGGLVIMEETAHKKFLGKMVAPAAENELSALTSLADLAEISALPLPSTLLPDLTSLQIENVQVLPEVNQALEQVKLALSEVSNFSISLSPAPIKVADIQASMTNIEGKVNNTLSSL
ncbi:MAG: hypothetical protein EBT70_00495 [Betaproteobacteria bacterium]|nr:hypothetical protein [Betaproteobacteria bacterium]